VPTLGVGGHGGGGGGGWRGDESITALYGKPINSPNHPTDFQ